MRYCSDCGVETTESGLRGGMCCLCSPEASEFKRESRRVRKKLTSPHEWQSGEAFKEEVTRKKRKLSGKDHIGGEPVNRTAVPKKENKRSDHNGEC